MDLQQTYLEQLAARVDHSPTLDFQEVKAECQKRLAEGAAQSDIVDFLQELLESEESLADYLG